MTLDTTQVLMGIQATLFVVVGFLMKNWINQVNNKLDKMIGTEQFRDRCDGLDEDIADLCNKNAAAHVDLWRRINGHRHMASCIKTEGRCEVTVGLVAIGEGGQS